MIICEKKLIIIFGTVMHASMLSPPFQYYYSLLLFLQFYLIMLDYLKTIKFEIYTLI